MTPPCKHASPEASNGSPMFHRRCHDSLVPLECVPRIYIITATFVELDVGDLIVLSDYTMFENGVLVRTMVFVSAVTSQQRHCASELQGVVSQPWVKPGRILVGQCLSNRK